MAKVIHRNESPTLNFSFSGLWCEVLLFPESWKVLTYYHEGRELFSAKSKEKGAFHNWKQRRTKDRDVRGTEFEQNQVSFHEKITPKELQKPSGPGMRDVTVIAKSWGHGDIYQPCAESRTSCIIPIWQTRKPSFRQVTIPVHVTHLANGEVQIRMFPVLCLVKSSQPLFANYKATRKKIIKSKCAASIYFVIIHYIIIPLLIALFCYKLHHQWDSEL